MLPSLAPALITWFETHARNLPWRGLEDPYAIWVSEVMLQQTRVETVVPYFQRWLERFPDLRTLANAPEDEILNAWEGLGYYRRARHLHQTAKILIEEHNGHLPQTPETLRELPGIGPYTAGAIASIAFQVDTPAIDGNVRRVITRVFNVETAIHTRQSQRTIRNLVRKHLPQKQAGTFNQALMDLGAQVCTPQSPSCSACPLADLCQARQLGIQELRPVREEKAPIPHHVVTAAVIHQDGSVLLAKRPPDALLGGMWEFPGGKQKPRETLGETLGREIEEELSVKVDVEQKLGVFQHAYTHYRVTLHAFHCSLSSSPIQPGFHTDWAWVPPEALDQYPMGKVDRLIARQLQGI